MSSWRMLPVIAVQLCALLLLCSADSKDGADFVPVQIPTTPSAGVPGGPMLDSATHRLAAGDFLQIDFYDGRSSEQYKVQVDAAGEIVLPLISNVRVEGLIPRDAAALLTQSFSEFYLHPQVSLQVLNYGLLEVFVFGPDYPGTIFKLNTGSRLNDLLKEIHSSEELLEPGKYRRLHLVRGGFDFTALTVPPQALPPVAGEAAAASTLSAPVPDAIDRGRGLAGFQNWRPWIEQRLHDPASQVWIIDPLQISVEGELSSYNIALADKDALFIPTPERFVDITGVASSGRYELLGEETLGELLRLAGTVNYRADLMNTVIKRRDDCGRLTRLIMNVYPVLDDLSCVEDFQLQNRDEIGFVASEQRVFVLGEVKIGNAFPFAEDSTVLDYIALAGGETPEANLAWIAIIRQERDRLDPQQPAEVIQVNFKDIAKGLPLATNYIPIPGDVIWVPPKGQNFDTSTIMQAAGTLVTSFALVENMNNNSSSTSK